MIQPWPLIESPSRRSYRVFSVRTDIVRSPRTALDHEFYVIESNDWVNIIPLTEDRQVVMVRQYRHGSRKITLEIPGGLVDPGDTPEGAAARELLEETGCLADAWFKIGAVSPNPALFNNLCHIFLASNVETVSGLAPDQTEDIERVLVPLDKIPGLIRKGEIDHAMVITAFHLYRLNHCEETAIP